MLPVQVGGHFVVAFLFLAMQLVLPGLFASIRVFVQTGQVAFGLHHLLLAVFQAELQSLQNALLEGHGLFQAGHELPVGLQQHGSHALAGAL